MKKMIKKMSITPNDSEPKETMVPPTNVNVVACIPTFNEQETIGSVILMTLKHVDKVYVCDDGSTDKTVDLSEALGVSVIRHENRKGLSESLRDLLGASIKDKPDAIVILEGDNLLYPEFIPDFVQPIKNLEADMVFGTVRERSPTASEKNGVEAIEGIEVNGSDETREQAIQVFSLSAAKRFYDLDTNILGEMAEELSYAKRTGLRTKMLTIEVEFDTPPTSPEVEPIHDADNVISESPKSIMPEISTTKKPFMIFGLWVHPRIAAISIVALVAVLAGAGLILHSGTLTKPNYTLLIQTPEGFGSTNPAAGDYSFSQGASTQVDATPAQGWRFDHWVIDNSTSNSTNPIAITMNGNETLRATFSQIQYVLTINTTGSGSTTPDVGVYTYSSNSTIQVASTPMVGWRLDHWTLDRASAGSGKSYTVKMDSNHTLSAAFTQIQYKLNVNILGKGSVSRNPDSPTYPYGTDVRLEATPQSGWVFKGWSGDVSGVNGMVRLTMNGDKNVTAEFSQSSPRASNYTLTIQIPQGTGWTSPYDGVYKYVNGSDAVVSATAGDGWQFDHWVLDSLSSGSSNPLTVTMSSNHTLEAVFTETGSPSTPQTFTLTVSTTGSGSGSVSLSPTGGTYASGTVVTLTATPATGSSFSGWSGDLSGSSNPTNITMGSEKSVAANFTAQLCTVSLIQVGQGTATISPSGKHAYGSTINLVASQSVSGWVFEGWSSDASVVVANPLSLSTTATVDGSGNVTATFTQSQYTLIVTIGPSAGGTVSPSVSPPYHYGDVVTLTESPSAGYSFSAWSGDGTGTGSTRSVNVTGNMAVTATFTQNVYTLTATVSPSAGGTVSPSVSPPYHYSDVVTLTESPSTGYTFSGWSGDGTGTGSTRSVTVTGDMSVTATFTEITYTLTVSIVGSGSGSVGSNTTGSSYASGTVITLTATPTADSSFTGWGGDLSGSSNPITITMDSAKSVTANFTLITYTLTVSTVGSGSGSVSFSPTGMTYASGTIVTLTATPAAGSSFSGWSGDLSGSSNPITLTMDSAKSVAADFTLIEYTVSVTVSPSIGGTVSKSPSQSTYHYSDVVTLTAAPAGNYTFTGWSVGLTGSANPSTLTVDGDMAVTAIFDYIGP
jgi:uncharacterized repeat protein (TIGR02543 family)